MLCLYSLQATSPLLHNGRSLLTVRGPRINTIRDFVFLEFELTNGGSDGPRRELHCVSEKKAAERGHRDSHDQGWAKPACPMID